METSRVSAQIGAQPTRADFQDLFDDVLLEQRAAVKVPNIHRETDSNGVGFTGSGWNRKIPAGATGKAEFWFRRLPSVDLTGAPTKHLCESAMRFTTKQA